MVTLGTLRGFVSRRRRTAALVACLSLVALLLPGSIRRAQADELQLSDGVVVKFGPNGEMVVLDGLIVQGQATLTSLQDDAWGGPVTSAPGSPQPGDWLGLRIERSSPAGLTLLGGLQIYYGGKNGPACMLRSTSSRSAASSSAAAPVSVSTRRRGRSGPCRICS